MTFEVGDRIAWDDYVGAPEEEWFGTVTRSSGSVVQVLWGGDDEPNGVWYAAASLRNLNTFVITEVTP